MTTTFSRALLQIIATTARTAACLGLFARIAAAQGCAMCYQNAAASGPQGITALRHGILILLLPAASFFLGIFVFIYRRRDLPR